MVGVAVGWYPFQQAQSSPGSAAVPAAVAAAEVAAPPRVALAEAARQQVARQRKRRRRRPSLVEMGILGELGRKGQKVYRCI